MEISTMQDIEGYLDILEKELDMYIAEIAIPFYRFKKTITWHEFDLSGQILDCAMPKHKQKILTYDKLGFISIDIFYNDGRDCYLGSGREFVYDVTHWMALPEPPKSHTVIE